MASFFSITYATYLDFFKHISFYSLFKTGLILGSFVQLFIFLRNNFFKSFETFKTFCNDYLITTKNIVKLTF